MAAEIFITATIAGLCQAVLHLMNWRLFLGGRDLPRLWRYVLGVLGLVLPLSGLLVVWREWPVLIALWSVIAAGGLTVIGLYWLEGLYDDRLRAREAAEREKLVVGDGRKD